MPFNNVGKCRASVYAELIVASFVLTLVVLCALAGLVIYFTTDLNYIAFLLHNEEQVVDEVIVLALRVVIGVQIVILVPLLIAGRNVLVLACSIPFIEHEWDLINRGVVACKIFCRIEVLRTVLLIATFIGELSFFNWSIVLELIRDVFSVPVLFGWFCVSEFQTELEGRLKEVINVDQLCTITTTSSSINNCASQCQEDVNESQS